MFARRSLIACLFAVALASSASAGQSSIPAAFADIGLGARIMGMGGAGSAGWGRAIDLAWNPAGLCLLEEPELTVMQTEQFGLVPTYFLAGALPRGENCGLAAGFISAGDVLLRENTLLLGAGRRIGFLGDLGLGATIKLRHASFGSGGTEDGVSGKAYGIALDLGCHGKLGRVALGLLIEEMLGTVRWNSSVRGQYHESVPPTITGGMQLAAASLCFAADLEFWLDEERPAKAAAGIEWTPYPILQIRSGFKQRLDAVGSRWLSLGAGLGHDLEQGGRLQLDTAYLFHDLGGSLRISLGYRL